MFKKWDSRYTACGITAFAVICASLLFYFFLLKLDLVLATGKLLFGIAAPIIYGLVLAFILRPVYNRLEQRLLRVNENTFPTAKMNRKAARVISTVITLALLALIVFALINLVLPQLVKSVTGIVENMPANMRQLSVWLNGIFENHPEWEKPATQLLTEIYAKLSTWAETEMLPQLTAIVTNVSLGVLGLLTAMMDIVVGIIVCVYVLNSKTTFCCQAKKICFAMLPEVYASKVIRGVRFADRVFLGFISGKLLDSLIIGILCFICLRFMNMPYVMLVSVIVGVTNIIPFFGPFIGAIPSAILILLVSPMQCLYFIIFIFALQQVDGNIIGPKILGGSTGLSSFWVIFAILMGGGLFGFPGMVLGVPTFSVFYHFIKYMAEKNLKKKGLPIGSEAYERESTDLNN